MAIVLELMVLSKFYLAHKRQEDPISCLGYINYHTIEL